MLIYTTIYTEKQTELINVYADKTMLINATVVSEPEYYSDYNSVVVETNELSNTNDKVKILMTYDDRTSLEYNNTLKILIKPTLIDKNSFKSEGIFLRTNAKSIKVLGKNKDDLYSKAIKFKSYIASVFIDNIKPELSGIPISMITGDKHYISDEFYSNVKECGMSHVMAVSGLHISIICLSVVNLLKRLRLGNWISSLAGITIVVIMAAVAGFTGSILRAGLMYLIVFGGELVSRKSDPLNSLGLAFCVLILYNPYNLYNVSLQLSGLGTLGILLFANGLADMLLDICPFKRFLSKPLKYFVDCLSVTLSANLLILPVSISTFGFISATSPLVNVVLSPVIYVCLLSALVALILSGIPVINNVIFYVVEKLSYIFKSVIEYFSEFKYSCFNKDDIMLYIILGIISVILILIFVLGQKRFISIILIVTLAVLMPISAIYQGYLNSRNYKYYFIQCDDGACMVIENANNFIVALNNTDSEAVKQAKQLINKKIEPNITALIIPNNDTKIQNRILSYFENYNIDHYLLEENDEVKNAEPLNGCKYSIWNKIILTSYRCLNGSNIYFDLGRNTIVYETNSAKAKHGSYIVTSNPLISYKINSNNCSYIISGNENGRLYQRAFRDKGVRAVTLDKNNLIFANQNNNEVLKFSQ